jgi:hypothetical protein
MAERGVTKALLGDMQAARNDFGSAEAAGLASAEFYFNFSKIVLDDFDTEAVRTYLNKAAAANPATAQALSAREKVIGERDAATFANVHAPFREVLRGVWSPSFAPSSYKVSKLFFGAKPLHLMVIGFVMCLFPFFPKGKAGRRRLSPYYAEYIPSRVVLALTRLIPGAPWVVCDKPVRAFAPVSLMFFLAMPIVGWPAESRWISELYPTWMTAYWAVFVIVTMSIVVLGLVTSEE